MNVRTQWFLFFLFYALIVFGSMAAFGDAFDELNAQRAAVDLPPLIEDPYLSACAQVKAEYIAGHRVTGPIGWQGRQYNGHEGPNMGVGYIEGTGQLMPSSGWATCAMAIHGSHKAGAGIAVNDSDGLRYMCLIVETGTIVTRQNIGGGRTQTTTKTKDPGEKYGQPNNPFPATPNTSHMTPKIVTVQTVRTNRIRPGKHYYGVLQQMGRMRMKKMRGSR